MCWFSREGKPEFPGRAPKPLGSCIFSAHLRILPPARPRTQASAHRASHPRAPQPSVVDYQLPGRVEPMSLLLFNRAFYPNLVRATIAGNGVTMAGSLLARFSHKAWLLFPFGDRGFGALGDVVFNTCWVFALICVGVILRQSYGTKRHSQVLR